MLTKLNEEQRKVMIETRDEFISILNKGLDEKFKCECCDSEVQWALISEYDKKIKYNLCSDCLSALTAYRLSPSEFFNLLKNGHTTKEFLLHSDFYDEDTGEALQPNR